MKKLIIPFVLSLLMITTINAQEQRGSERKQKAQHQKHEIKKQLNLSEDQKNKMKSIHEKYREQAKVLKSNDDITRGDYKKQMGEINEKRKIEVEANLTSEQKNKMKEIRENKQREMKEMRAERFEKMSNKLQLDEKQKAILLEQRKNSAEQMKAIRENSSLSNIQKKEQIKGLREKQKIFTKSILTEEQKKKIEHRKKDKAIK